MTCSACNTVNDSENIFCIGCGKTFGPNVSALPTLVMDQNVAPTIPSTETAVLPVRPVPQFTPTYTPASVPAQPGVSSKSPIMMVVIGLLLLTLLGVVAAFVVVPRLTPAEVLPDHLGLFSVSDNKDRLDEVKRSDHTNLGDARNTLTKGDSLPTIISRPNLIFYADSRDIPIADVRLVQLDAIKDDGNLKTLDFQAKPVDGKPDMKYLRIPDGLANGKYAFAFFSGFFNEGNHKLWAFQVKDSNRSDNGDALKAFSVALKPKTQENNNNRSQASSSTVPGTTTTATPPPMPAAPPPTGTRVVNSNFVRVRVGPSSSSAFHPTFRYSRGSQVVVTAYVGYECPAKGKGCGPWAQLENGYYVHSSLLR